MTTQITADNVLVGGVWRSEKSGMMIGVLLKRESRDSGWGAAEAKKAPKGAFF
ncbi:hypothetical protein [Serratia marcescens]|uniref:hypothetical protein n=1 Tax=Serratia marcescens TaxID=615 RepID=UPI0039831FBB